MPLVEIAKALPETVAALVRDGRHSAAEQRLLTLIGSCDMADRSRWALCMAEVWSRTQDNARTRRWLARMPPDASKAESLRAAHLARSAGDVVMACEWFEHAFSRSHDAPMSDEDRLAFGQCALAAGERTRLRYGRQGCWERHLALLSRAEQVLSELAASTHHEAIALQATSSGARASRLLGKKARRQHPA